MPIYEFKCPNCGVFEKLSHRLIEKANCPKCGEKSARIMSVPRPPIMKLSIHTDSGLPQEYISHTKRPELFERSLKRQGKMVQPEDV
jgi:putative FmdB family regulatory protein